MMVPHLMIHVLMELNLLQNIVKILLS